MRKTPLNAAHHDKKARLADFCGYELPVWYTSIVDEHNAVRTNAGVFDVSHMGRLYVGGKSAGRFLDHLLTRPAQHLQVGGAQLCLMCLGHGGILDDLWVYRMEEERYLMIWNACNHEKKLAWAQSHSRPYQDVVITDISAGTSMIAVQGPSVPGLDILRDIAGLARFNIASTKIAGIECMAARTGYTGEDGFEIIANIDDALSLWKVFSDEGIRPCGLGARDSLRMEAGMLLYGQDMDDNINPYEADLGWLVDIDGRDFIGKEALLTVREKGASRKLVGFIMSGKEIARHGYDICEKDKHIGNVTSGARSITLGYNIGFGYVPTKLSKIGTEIDVMIRNRPLKAHVTKRRFYTGRTQ